MSSYNSIRNELAQVDQMILQAHALHLIPGIHHDLVKRKDALFAKAAKLDADSVHLWKKDGSFFYNVMQQIDLFSSGQIDEDTLYNRIPKIKKSAEKAAAAVAAAAASAATFSAAVAISAAISTSTSTSARAGSSADAVGKMHRLSTPSFVLSTGPDPLTQMPKRTTTSPALRHDLHPNQPTIRCTDRKIAPLRNPSKQVPAPISAAAPAHTSMASTTSSYSPPRRDISPPPAPIQTRKRALTDSDMDYNDTEGEDSAEETPPRKSMVKTRKAQQGAHNTPKKTAAKANLVTDSEKSGKRPEEKSLRSAMKQKEKQNTAAEENDDDERLLATRKKARATIKQDKGEDEWIPNIRPKKSNKVIVDEEEDDELYSSSGEETKKKPASRPRGQGRNITGTNQFFPQPCNHCSSRNVRCEKPMTGRSCILCKIQKIKCVHAAAYWKQRSKKLKLTERGHDSEDEGSDKGEVTNNKERRSESMSSSEDELNMTGVEVAAVWNARQKQTSEKVKLTQRERNSQGEGRDKGKATSNKDQGSESMNRSVAQQPTIDSASTPPVGTSSGRLPAVANTKPNSNDARLERIEAGYANMERMLLALLQNHKQS